MLFKYKEDIKYNLIAFGLLFFAYLSGWVLFFSNNWWKNVIGILLLTQSMVIAAFFVHEFAHGNIFKSAVWNKTAGTFFMWLTFHGFFSFKQIQLLHLAHHRNCADVIHFDFHQHFIQKPIQKKILIALEWAYIPVVELIVKKHSLQRIWQSNISEKRQLIVVSLLFYSTFFLLLAEIQPKALLYLGIAYILFLHILRFMDMHQHTYISYSLDKQGRPPKLPIPDEIYEQANTYSNLFSSRYAWLNWLTLNFGYHNAHHAKPFIPWCCLPELHKKSNYTRQELSVFYLFINYHRFRIQRIFESQTGKPDMESLPSLRAKNFIGVIGASFLNA